MLVELSHALTEPTYTYDPYGHLTLVKKGLNTVESYTYDANGRRTGDHDGRTYTYHADDRLLSVGNTAYTYTNDGARATKSLGGTTVAAYSYTPSGELGSVALTDPANSTNNRMVEYVYDAAGRRIARTLKNANGTVISVQKYLWAGMTTLLAVYDGTSGTDQLVARFEYAGGRMPLKMVQNGTTYYLAYDQIGSLRAVFDTSGNLVHEIQYDSFGNVQPGTLTSSLVVPFGFAGGLSDTDTGLVHFGFRDYNPDTGQWTSKDPLCFSGGDLYLYAYCANDPLNLYDTLGLLAWYDQAINASANAAAGFGDTISFEITSLVRNLMNTNDYVDISSAGYKIGVVGGYAWGIACAVATCGAPTTGVANLARNGIGANRVIGENALKSLGGRSEAFFRTSRGARYADQFVDNVIHEAKTGPTCLTKRIMTQIAKDEELLKHDMVRDVVWHFFRSPDTGSGLSLPLINALHKAGITIRIGL
jgi:RHS repeat-associated protein